MDVITVSQALRKQEGELIIAMKGRLTDINAPITGQNAEGDYSFQFGKLQCTEDPKVKIKIKIWNHQDLKSMRGAILYLESTRGEGKKANQWFGVKRVIDTYRNPEGIPMIECTAKAQVSTTDPNGAAPQGNAPAPRQQAAAQKTNQETRPASGAPQGKPATQAQTNQADQRTDLEKREDGYREAIGTARLKLAKSANLYLLTMKAANHIAEEFHAQTGRHMTPDHFQACCASLFISAEKQFLSGGLPPGDLAKYLPAPSQKESGQAQS